MAILLPSLAHVGLSNIELISYFVLSVILVSPSSRTSPVRPSTRSTGPSVMTPRATSSATRRPVTATTPRDRTTCSFPTVVCRPSSTSWTVTPATWPRSTTRARLVTTQLSLVPSSPASTDMALTPTSLSNLTIRCQLESTNISKYL